MKKIKIFIYLNLFILLLSSCGSIKEGFINPKKNNSDEFLVEKKSPLVMPPNFDELPIPDAENEKKGLEENDIKDLITDNKSSNSVVNSDNNIEDSILDKIKSK
jgi:hypothetical protein